MTDRDLRPGGFPARRRTRQHTFTLTRSVGALQVRGETFVASQLPPSTQLAMIEPAAESDGMATVQTEDGVLYLVFECDLTDVGI